MVLLRNTMNHHTIATRCIVTCWLRASVWASVKRSSHNNRKKKFDVPLEGLYRSVDAPRPAPSLGSTDRRG